MSVRPPQAVVTQMMMAAWTAQTISAVTRLGEPAGQGAHGGGVAGAL
jgi:hypothetical protein